MGWLKPPNNSEKDAASRPKADGASASTGEYPKLVLLISRMSTGREAIQQTNTNKIEAMIKAQDMGTPETVDGSDSANADRRNELFDISGQRGKYPLLFLIEKKGDKPIFLGDYETVQDMNDDDLFTRKKVFGQDDQDEEQSPASAVPDSAANTESNVGPDGEDPAESDGPVKTRGQLQHPHHENNSKRIDATGEVKPDIESQKNRSVAQRSRARPSLKQDTYFALSQRRRLKQEEKDKFNPMSKKKKRQQVMFCFAMGFFIVAFIVAVSITIITTWDSFPTSKAEFELVQSIPGNLITLAPNGEALVVKDNYGFYQLHNIFGQNIGPTFRARGNVVLSTDVIAYINDETQRLEMKKYNDYSILEGDDANALFVTGDDISFSSDVSVLTVGTYGLGTITSVNGKVGEGTISAYKYNGTVWFEHGKPISKIFGLKAFKVSAAGTGMVTVAEQNGTTTLTGYTAFDDDGIFSWLRSDTLVQLETSETSVAAARDTYAVAFNKSAQVFHFSGRSYGQPIQARENATILSVALSLDGRMLAVGSMDSNSTAGVVDFYYFPRNQDSGDEWRVIGNPLHNDALEFGSKLALDADYSTLAVQAQKDVFVYYINKIPEEA